jgi:hypothetical protein
MRADIGVLKVDAGAVGVRRGIGRLEANAVRHPIFHVDDKLHSESPKLKLA